MDSKICDIRAENLPIIKLEGLSLYTSIFKNNNNIEKSTIQKKTTTTTTTTLKITRKEINKDFYSQVYFCACLCFHFPSNSSFPHNPFYNSHISIPPVGLPFPITVTQFSP